MHLPHLILPGFFLFCVASQEHTQTYFHIRWALMIIKFIHITNANDFYFALLKSKLYLEINLPLKKIYISIGDNTFFFE